MSIRDWGNLLEAIIWMVYIGVMVKIWRLLK